MKKIKEHFRRMQNVAKMHGLKAVFAIYLTKIPIIKDIVKLLFRPLLVKTKILGNVMYLDAGDLGLHRKLLLKGIREPEHTNQIMENVRPGMKGIEIGANVGYFALLAAKQVGQDGFIYCIEPEPRNLGLLLKNIKANGFDDRIKVFQYLVGNHNGREKLYLSEFANVHSLSKNHPKSSKRFIEVPMITLDSFLKENGLKPEDIDFIRMDIEGYEVIAFQGMQELFKSARPLKIFMEFHPSYYPEWGWTFEKLLRYLDSFGFKVKEIAKKSLILKEPSIEEILAMQKNTQDDGSQAFLEKVK